MAKKRHLKRDIGYVAGELFTEVLVSKMLIPGIDTDKADALMERILEMQDKFVSRVNGLDGKGNKTIVKAYFKKLNDDLQAEVDAIAEEIDKLGSKPAEA